MAKCSSILKTGARANARANKLIDRQAAMKKKGDKMYQEYDKNMLAYYAKRDELAAAKKANAQKMKDLQKKQMAERAALRAAGNAAAKKIDAQSTVLYKKKEQIRREGKKLKKQYDRTDKQAAAAQAKAKAFMAKHKECKLKPITRKRPSKLRKM